MIKTEGFDYAIRGLNELARGNIFDDALFEYAQMAQAKTAPYPPPKPTSDRKGDLGRGWSVKKYVGKSIIENRATKGRGIYSGWVQQRETQAWFHRGYWPTIEDKAEDNVDIFYKAVERRVRAYFGR